MTATITTTTTPMGRVTALGRAELTLLSRNTLAMLTALLLPVGMVAVMRPTIAQMDLEKTGLDVNAVSMSGGVGFVLLFVVYYNLVTVYVARREELVLKRLRTGEASDLEILVGTALPAVAVALVQCLVLIAAGTALLDLDMPERAELLVAAVALGLVLLTALAAASTVITRTVEMAQITTTPLLFLSLVGSGLIIPLETMPDALANVCRLLPMTPVLELVRAGWVGGVGAHDVLGALATALVWTGLAVFAVRRWFRWEPRC
jgi:ABC-2 type transport system permease protein